MSLNRKIAYINLTTGEIETKPVPARMRELFLGGRGLDAYLMYNHIEPGIDPLGPDNVAFVSAGVLVGTLASASARTHIAGKSPLTGFLGSTNMGGFFAPELRWAGFDHLVIKGRAERPVYLWIHNGEIEIRDAGSIWGRTVRESQQAIRKELGDRDVKVMTIGMAGEKLVRFAPVAMSKSGHVVPEYRISRASRSTKILARSRKCPLTTACWVSRSPLTIRFSDARLMMARIAMAIIISIVVYARLCRGVPSMLRTPLRRWPAGAFGADRWRTATRSE